MRLLVWSDGKWIVHDGVSRDEARPIALGPTPAWVRADGDPASMALLGDWFDLHPLAVEDLRNERQRPKVEDYPGVTFVVLRVPRFDGEDLEWRSLGVFVGEGFVLTAGSERIPELEDAERRIIAGDWRGREGHVDMVFYAILDAAVDAWFPYMDALEDHLEDLEDAVLDSADRDHLRRIRDMKDLASRTRKVLSPLREAMQSLERAEHPNVKPATRVYLRDVADHAVRLSERLEHVREMALIAQETWNATLANTQNELMKRLTVIAALLLVPGLAAGLGGMNFDGFPEWDYWTVTSIILGATTTGFLLAALKKWL